MAARKQFEETADYITKNQNSLYEAVMRLPENERIIMELRFYEEFSLKEIAEITKTNLSTVKTRLYRGLAALRLEVGE